MCFFFGKYLHWPFYKHQQQLYVQLHFQLIQQRNQKPKKKKSITHQKIKKAPLINKKEKSTEHIESISMIGFVVDLNKINNAQDNDYYIKAIVQGGLGFFCFFFKKKNLIKGGFLNWCCKCSFIFIAKFMTISNSNNFWINCKKIKSKLNFNRMC